MLALVVAAPLLVLRTRRRLQFSLVFVALLAMVPYLAGQEIRQRFFSIQQYQTDGSANARFSSWEAAIQIANDHPVFGVGIRNANLVSYRYGADLEGRTIHSQYLQTLADAGYPGLFFYLVALACTWVAMARARRVLKRRDDPEAKLAHSMLNGVEGALFIFCFGAVFLSLEVFELPYLMALMGAQIASLTRVPVVAPSKVPVAAALPVAPLRA
jgi:O-antigen ligase